MPVMNISQPCFTPNIEMGQSHKLSVNEAKFLDNDFGASPVSLEARRQAFRDDLGPIPEVTVDFMLKHIIPNSNVDVNATMSRLEEAGVWSEALGWKEFKGKPKELAGKTPASTNFSETAETSDSLSETQISREVMKMYNSIVSHTQFYDDRIREPTLAFEDFLSSSPVSDTATAVQAARSIHDVLTTAQGIHTMHLDVASTCTTGSHLEASNFADPGPPNWCNIACLGEYKTLNRTEDLNENVLSILWNLNQIMHIDHRRRFAFGITVENENVRIWFACRQVVFVTRPFNFITDAPLLVQLFGSLAYATPSQLGYDPTMTLRWRHNSYQYDIECTGKRLDGSERTTMCHTQKVLSDTAYTLRGRATRVYLVTAVDQDYPTTPARPFVLKDSWIDADRPKEGETYCKLLEGASEEEKTLFLTVHQHGVVQIEDQNDSTKDLILKGQKIDLPDDRKLTLTSINPLLQMLYDAHGKNVPPPESASITVEQVDLVRDVRLFHLYNPPTTNPQRSTSQTSLSDSVYQPINAPRHNITKRPIVYSPKLHYRIVFEDVGESLMKLADSGKATIPILGQTMRDITRALKYVAKQGYVHRDVSPGNILWFGDHAKLSDLEFAREYRTEKSAYSRAGTYNFMAGEVMSGKHSVEKYAKKNATVPFVHNPIHDLESLWWVGVWCSMWYYPAPFEKIIHGDHTVEYKYRDFNETERRHMELVRMHGRQLFPSSNICSDIHTLRMEEIHDPVRYASRAQDQYPKVLQTFTFCLHAMKQCISWAYTKIQSELPRTEASYFTDVLRIGDPTAFLTEVDACVGDRLPVHDRVLQAFGMLREYGEVEDAILWPLEHMDQYSHWLATQQAEGTNPTS